MVAFFGWIKKRLESVDFLVLHKLCSSQVTWERRDREHDQPGKKMPPKVNSFLLTRYSPMEETKSLAGCREKPVAKRGGLYSPGRILSDVTGSN